MTYLLDVNVLIALLDPLHAAHQSVHRWYEALDRAGIATCPTTENGFIRIVSNRSYANPVASPAEAVAAIGSVRSVQGFVFWPDSLSLVASNEVDVLRILSHSQVTDTYLLALARKNGGQLATLDRRLVTGAVHDGAKSLHLIGAVAH